MLLLKLLQHIRLLLIIARRLAHLLLPLIIHHLLHHAPRLSIQITEFTIFWCDLGGVDLRCGGHDVRPPFHLVDFVEVDAEFFAAWDALESP